jgi:[ribosomal protein S18]-alanine N-acetyltransferase
MTAFAVRPVTTADLDLLVDLYARSFDEPYARPALESLIASPGAWATIAWRGGSVGRHGAGFIIARAVAGEGEILSLGVAIPERRRGAGRALLTDALYRLALSGADAVLLEVGEDNPSAIALYHGLGFREVGRRRGYYLRKNGQRVSALVMRYPVKKSDYSSE